MSLFLNFLKPMVHVKAIKQTDWHFEMDENIRFEQNIGLDYFYKCHQNIKILIQNF